MPGRHKTVFLIGLVVAFSGLSLSIYALFFSGYELLSSPTVTSVTPTGFTTSWQARSSREHTVSVRERAGAEPDRQWDKEIQVMPNDGVYTAVVDGLQPGTRYEYAITFTRDDSLVAVWVGEVTTASRPAD